MLIVSEQCVCQLVSPVLMLIVSEQCVCQLVTQSCIDVDCV